MLENNHSRRHSLSYNWELSHSVRTGGQHGQNWGRWPLSVGRSLHPEWGSCWCSGCKCWVDSCLADTSQRWQVWVVVRVSCSSPEALFGCRKYIYDVILKNMYTFWPQHTIYYYRETWIYYLYWGFHFSLSQEWEESVRASSPVSLLEPSDEPLVLSYGQISLAQPEDEPDEHKKNQWFKTCYMFIIFPKHSKTSSFQKLFPCPLTSRGKEDRTCRAPLRILAHWPSTWPNSSLSAIL